MTTSPAIQWFHTAYERMLSLGSNLKGKHFSPGELTNKIRKQFPATDFIFYTHKDYAVDPDMVIVSGIYDCYSDEDQLPSIEITFSYHPEQKQYFIDLLDWKQLSFDLAECVGHEMIHQALHNSNEERIKTVYQWDDEDQDYLGDEDEIDAYAFSIAAEALTFNRPYTDTVMYVVYEKTFDSNPEILLKLQNQITVYQKQLEVLNEQIHKDTRDQ